MITISIISDIIPTTTLLSSSKYDMVIEVVNEIPKEKKILKYSE